MLISGRGSNMVALADAAAEPDCPFEIACVLSNEPQAPGLAEAARRGLPTWAHPHGGLKRAEFDALLDAQLRAHRAGYVALAGYMRLLSPAFVDRWAGRMVNIHPSLLPAHKGLDTHARVLAAGDEAHGCTVHLVTAALDDGPILGQARVAVLPGDDEESLAARVLAEEHRLYARCLAALVSR